MQIIFDNNPDKAVEEIYMLIKTAVKTDVFCLKQVEALAELTTELANRIKAGEFDGKQENQECP